MGNRSTKRSIPKAQRTPAQTRPSMTPNLHGPNLTKFAPPNDEMMLKCVDRPYCIRRTLRNGKAALWQSLRSSFSVLLETVNQYSNELALTVGFRKDNPGLDGERPGLAQVFFACAERVSVDSTFGNYRSQPGPGLVLELRVRDGLCRLHTATSALQLPPFPDGRPTPLTDPSSGHHDFA